MNLQAEYDQDRRDMAFVIATLKRLHPRFICTTPHWTGHGDHLRDMTCDPYSIMRQEQNESDLFNA